MAPVRNLKQRTVAAAAIAAGAAVAEDAKTGIMGVLSGVRNIFRAAPAAEPVPEPIAQPLTAQEKRVMDLRDAVLSINKYFDEWGTDVRDNTAKHYLCSVGWIMKRS